MNFGYLLGRLLILILSVAISQEIGVRGKTWRLVVEPALIFMLLMGVWGLGKEKKWFMMIGCGIAATGLAIALLNYFLNIAGLRLVNMAISPAFFVASIWIASRHLLPSGEINIKIIGATCISLLPGLNGGMCYLFINMAIRDSLHGLTSTTIGAQFSELMYFSFVTITTLGYATASP
ncbi:MAG: hypothetical protein OEW33_06145 [Nitrospirota bacterium]|nr:hypothetical protein [Nitrospirota bacterium]